MIERISAAVALAACVLLLLRLGVGARRRQRVDAALRQALQLVRGWAVSLRHRRLAARVADDAIRRARGRGEWEGNVYKPKSFRKRPRDSKPPRDKMH